MTYQNHNWVLVRFNKDNCMSFLDLQDRIIEVDDDINNVIEDIHSLLLKFFNNLIITCSLLEFLIFPKYFY